MAVEPFVSSQGTSGVWVEMDLRRLPGWRVAALFLQRGGTEVLVELRVLPDDDSDPGLEFNPGEWSQEIEAIGPGHGGITADHLRAVSLVGLETVATNAADFLSGVQGKRERRAQRMSATPERPGRAGRDPAYYAAWAQRYVEALPEGKPIKRLANKHDLKESQVRDVIHQARVRHFLTKGTQGKAGGALTDTARALLEDPTTSATTKER